MSQARYYFEQTFLPISLFTEKGRAAMLPILRESGSEALFFICSELYKRAGEECPYGVEQFNVKFDTVLAKDAAPEFEIITIDMPEPEEMPLASRIFLCLDKEAAIPGYYLMEKSFDTNSMLCGRDANGNHFNYGNMSDSEKEQFEKVCDLYGKNFE